MNIYYETNAMHDLKIMTKRLDSLPFNPFKTFSAGFLCIRAKQTDAHTKTQGYAVMKRHYD